ncbi:hypothetical protein [Heliomicrobium undosum]|uniref:hypothetical protein n=1 Tax=Heliomicrobium undosum TaxID=121734 RepID=UPI001A9A9830|nr:hypothetical protein [Heliomicrobium undosum]
MEAAAMLVALGWMSLSLSAPMADPDFFWHLQAGRWILGNGQIPRTDPFSFTMNGQPWIAHEWLFEMILSAVERFFGYTGVVGLGIVLYALFLTLLTRWLLRAAPGAGDGIRCLAILAITFSLTPFWSLRPQLFCFVLLTAFLLFYALRTLSPDFHQPYEKYILGGWILMFLAAAACRSLPAPSPSSFEEQTTSATGKTAGDEEVASPCRQPSPSSSPRTMKKDVSVPPSHRCRPA